MAKWRVGPGGDAVNMDRVCRLVARLSLADNTFFVEAIIVPSSYWVVVADGFPSVEAAREWIELEVDRL